MGRPTRNNVDYFPHFANARNGKTLKILQSIFGNDGYACFFKLLEILGESKGHYYFFGDFGDWMFLVSEFGVDEEKATRILELLSRDGAIDPDLYAQKIIWSENFAECLEPVYRKRGREKPSRPGYCDDNWQVAEVSAPETQGSEVSVPESTQRKEKERKGKERKKRSASSLPEIRSLKPDWWTTEEWEELIVHRTKKKATQTPRAYNSLIREFEISKSKGYTANEILDAMSSGKGWSGFKAEWIKSPPASQQNLPGIKTSGRSLVLCKECQGHITMQCSFEDLSGPIDCPQFY